MNPSLLNMNVPSINTNLKKSLDSQQGEEKKAIDTVNNKPFIIVHTKDITIDDMLMLNSYGTTTQYDYKKYAGLDVETIVNKLNVKYLLVDLRDRNNRSFFSSIKNKSSYNVVALLCKIEKYTNILETLDSIVDNVLYKFPDAVAFAETFNQLLLSPKLSIPSKVESLFSCCLNFQSSLSK